MTQVALDVLHTGPVVSEESASSEPGRLTGFTRRLSALRATPHLATYAGIVVAAAGLGLLVLAWGRTAGIASNVALQVPYVISAGFTGVALVVVGLTIVNLDAKRAAALERRRRPPELRGLPAERRAAVGGAS